MKKETLTSVCGPTPNAWASDSPALVDLLDALDRLEAEGDPRALALRFAGLVAATHAANAMTNVEVFEKTASVLARVASDLRRFGWVRGVGSEAANDNASDDDDATTKLLLDVRG